MNTIWLFPGQSSFHPSVVGRALSLNPGLLLPVVEAAEHVLGRPLRSLTACNRDVQVGVFLASHLHSLALADAGIEASASLGLSLGEWNHLVHIGAVDFLDALRLVDARGEAYDAGPPGAMAAIFPLPLDALEPLLAEGVAVSNLNSPTQNVVAGPRDAVAETCRRVEEETYAQARVIEPRIAMHHPLFAPVAEQLAPVFAAGPWRPPPAAYRSNVLGGVVADPTAARIADLLTRHVFEPVRWRACVEQVVAEHPDATLVEVGPGAVLHGLLRRSWLDVSRLHTADRAAFAQTMHTLTARRSHAG